MWEEPCVSGTKGSGAVFFCGCSLGCVYCQNHEISGKQSLGRGLRVTPEKLRGIFLELCAKGVHNLNLVTPTPYTPAILEALGDGVPVPVIYNCGGYESLETLDSTAGKIDIFLTDLKYGLSGPAAAYSRAPDYPAVARAAVRRMYELTGDYELDSAGLMKKGVIIRHLVLPGEEENTRAVIDAVAEDFRPGQVMFSLMSQYTPPSGRRLPENLGRTLSRGEYRRACERLFASGIEDGYVQDPGSAKGRYLPEFELLRPESR